MRQNSDYHCSEEELHFYMAGWTNTGYGGPSTPDVSVAGIFSFMSRYIFDPSYGFSDPPLHLGSPAAELENQICCCLYTYKC